MALLHRVKAVWSSWPGAPGYSTFYFLSGNFGGPPAVRTFFNAIRFQLPLNLQVDVPGTGDIIDDATGAITGVWSTDDPAVVVGDASTNYAGSAGAVVLWSTDVTVNGRRPLGKTYLVPLANNSFDTGGSLDSGVITLIKNAAQAMIDDAGSELRVWHRPDPITHVGGSSSPAVSARVPDLAAVLRSRRR